MMDTRETPAAKLQTSHHLIQYQDICALAILKTLLKKKLFWHILAHVAIITKKQRGHL